MSTNVYPQVKKRESLSPDQLPRRRAAFPSSLRDFDSE